MRWLSISLTLTLLPACQNDCDNARDQAGDAWHSYVKRIRDQEAAAMDAAAAAAKVEGDLQAAGHKRGHRQLSKARRSRINHRNNARNLARWASAGEKLEGLARRGWWGGAIPDGKKQMKRDASAGIPHRATEAALEACKPH